MVNQYLDAIKNQRIDEAYGMITGSVPEKESFKRSVEKTSVVEYKILDTSKENDQYTVQVEIIIKGSGDKQISNKITYDVVNSDSKWSIFFKDNKNKNTNNVSS
ncbi:hypothetical protein [Brevibacillus borstelensis]|uniref:hypothetical protein n=1 Tax=Brevibacillus borstelensis TaxID=45462 RepID=UPI0030C612B7